MSYELDIIPIEGEEGLVKVLRPQLYAALNALARIDMNRTNFDFEIGSIGKIQKLRELVQPERKNKAFELTKLFLKGKIGELGKRLFKPEREPNDLYLYFQRSDVEAFNKLFGVLDKVSFSPLRDFQNCMALLRGDDVTLPGKSTPSADDSPLFLSEGMEVLLRPAFQMQIERGVDERAGLRAKGETLEERRAFDKRILTGIDELIDEEIDLDARAKQKVEERRFRQDVLAGRVEHYMGESKPAKKKTGSKNLVHETYIKCARAFGSTLDATLAPIRVCAVALFASKPRRPIRTYNVARLRSIEIWDAADKEVNRLVSKNKNGVRGPSTDGAIIGAGGFDTGFRRLEFW